MCLDLTVSERGLLLLGFTSLRVQISTRGLEHDSFYIFDVKNYDDWKSCMLDFFRDIHPCIEGILYMGLSSPTDPQNKSLEEKVNFYIDAQATKILLLVVSNIVISSIMPYWSAHEI